MEMWQPAALPWLIFIASMFPLISSEMIVDTGKPCTYFGGTRVSRNENNLVNCSWYANNACCKRTEVTSVFGGMYPLYGATDNCRNRMNYLMCYFCSPEQYLWFDRKAHVCLEYCESLYEECKAAEYNGTSLGIAYLSGRAFCHGQKFEVIDGKDGCFKFDPTVFGCASHFNPSTLTFAIIFFLFFTQS